MGALLKWTTFISSVVWKQHGCHHSSPHATAQIQPRERCSPLSLQNLLLALCSDPKCTWEIQWNTNAKTTITVINCISVNLNMGCTEKQILWITWHSDCTDGDYTVAMVTSPVTIKTLTWPTPRQAQRLVLQSVSSSGPNGARSFTALTERETKTQILNMVSSHISSLQSRWRDPIFG